MISKINKVLESIRPEFDFSKSDSFIEDGMLDSFDLINLISSLDTEFNISIDGIDIVPENFKNLETISRLLKKYIR